MIDKQCQICGTPTTGEPIKVTPKDGGHRWEKYKCTSCGMVYTIGITGDKVDFIGGGFSLMIPRELAHES